MAYQQRLTDRPFAVIELFVERTTMAHIRPILPQLQECIALAMPAMYYAIGIDQERMDKAIQRMSHPEFAKRDN